MRIVEALRPQVTATEIYFTDENGNRLEDEAMIEVELTDSNMSYQLYWVEKPDNTTDKSVRFICDNELIEISEDGLVTFFAETTAQIVVVTADGGEQQATIILYPKRNTGGDVGDL